MQISPDLTVGECREKLIDHYKKETCKVQLRPWDKEDTIDVKNIFTVVQMVTKDRTGANMLERTLLRGSVNDIFSVEVNGNRPDRILLIAAAGKGKTTAVAKLAYDWAHSVEIPPLKDLPLLFVLKLRNVDAGSSIEQAIISELLSDVKYLVPGNLERFLYKNQKHCYIILDGLDEYNGTICKTAKISSNVVSIIKSKELPKCRVLVTTRPHLEADFNQGDLPRQYAKMEIEGFSRKNAHDYIDKFFGTDEQLGESLKSYLDKSDVINELISIPFFCLMACHLWGENLLSGITTQTRLFNNINSFLRRHLERKRDSTIPEEEFQKTISELGKVALAGLLSDKNKLVFSPDDFEKLPETLQEGCELGIISNKTAYVSHAQPGERVTKTSVEFYHKLAQEHSAGKYLAKESNSMLSYVKRSEPDIVFKKIKNRISDYENLLRFAAGTNDTICLRVMETIITSKNILDNEKYRILLDCASESSDLTGKSSTIVNKCIRNKTVFLSNPTAYTATGLSKLPAIIKHTVRPYEMSLINITLVLVPPYMPYRFYNYVKVTQFRSPLHQHSVKHVHQVMKLYISKLKV